MFVNLHGQLFARRFITPFGANKNADAAWQKVLMPAELAWLVGI